MLSLLWSKLLTSVSVTGFGMPGRACMTFNVPVRPTVDINIGTKRHMSPRYSLQELGGHMVRDMISLKTVRRTTKNRDKMSDKL